MLRGDCIKVRLLSVAYCLWSVADTAKMADALSKVPDVDIDPEGQFKYILVNIKFKGGTEHKVIVRGTKAAEYHSKCAH